MIVKDMIILDKEYLTKKELLRAYSELAFAKNLVSSKEDFLTALWDREEVLPTSVGNNIAIPHCQSDTVLEPFVGLIRNDVLIEWDSQEKANLIFIIAIPMKTSGQLHLQTLAKLSRKLMHEEFIETLLQSNIETSYEILKKTLEEDQ